MMIVCPSCATSYMIEPGSLGPAGRMVRCARCKTAWFAGGPKAKADVSGFVDKVIAEAEGRPAGPARPRPSTPPPSRHSEPPHAASAADEFGAEPNMPIGAAQRPASEESSTVQHSAELPPEREPVPVSDAPSLIPAAGHDSPAGHSEADADEVESFVARRARMQAKRKTMRRSSKWTALILLLFGFNVAMIGARSEVVRYLPQTASLFAAVGLPVNLRHLTFENVKISKEENDGAGVLVVEGTIVGSSSKPVEVPRLRFAVRNVSGQEIYSWSAMPSRSILPPGEKLSFRSRLASPPADASDVVVRFFTSRDAAPETK